VATAHANAPDSAHTRQPENHDRRMTYEKDSAGRSWTFVEHRCPNCKRTIIDSGPGQ